MSDKLQQPPSEAMLQEERLAQSQLEQAQLQRLQASKCGSEWEAKQRGMTDEKNPVERMGESIEKGGTARTFEGAGEHISRGKVAQGVSKYAQAMKDATANMAKSREAAAETAGKKSMGAPLLGAVSAGAESFEKGAVAHTATQAGESIKQGKVAEFASAVGQGIKRMGEAVSGVVNPSRTTDSGSGSGMGATTSLTQRDMPTATSSTQATVTPNSADPAIVPPIPDTGDTELVGHQK